MGQFLLTAGAAGKRYTLPNARIMMHQPLAGLRGQASDIAIQAEQLRYTKRRMAELIAHHSGQPLEQIQADSERDRWFTADGREGVRPRRQGDPAPRRDPLTATLVGVQGPCGTSVDHGSDVDRTVGLEPRVDLGR